MKLVHLFLISVFILISQFGISQDYKFISKDLHEMSEDEMMKHQVQFGPDIAMYDKDGNTIAPNQINDIMMSGNFIPIIFGNTKHEAKALVFREATKEEKEILKKQTSFEDPNANFTAGQIAKDFITMDLDGNEVKLKELKGKTVVINFWFIACKPCVQEIPDLNKIKAKYTKEDVVFLAVTFDKKAQLQKFLKKNEFNYQIITDMNLIQEYNVSSFPTHLIIDKNGEIVFKKVGAFIEELDEKIGLLVAN